MPDPSSRTTKNEGSSSWQLEPVLRRPPPSAAQQPTPGKAIAIVHETFGDPSDPAVLLVMGFGTQMLGWDAVFCQLLAARGCYVIRYDNRDCGLSTKLDEHPLHLADFIDAVTSGDFDS